MTTKDLTTKEMLARAISTLPEDATLMDALDCVLLVFKIQEGLDAVAAGRTVSQEEAHERLRKWRG